MADTTGKIVWDASGKRLLETGVSNGVLYPMSAGVYGKGVAWNGLTTVTESPSGAELTDLFADNIKYASLRSAETFGGTIEAYTYPDEFAACDGSVAVSVGVYFGQQSRSPFGFCYKTKIASDTDPDGTAYKLHIVYGATASPSEKAYASVNDSPDGINFSWEFSTVPIAVTGYKPVSLIVIDSTKVNSAKLAALELILYGKDAVVEPASAAVDPRLPLPSEIITLMAH